MCAVVLFYQALSPNIIKMSDLEIKKAFNGLFFRFPVIGHHIRMNAIKKLSAIGSDISIPYLIEALNSFDLKVKEFAMNSLLHLKGQDKIDAFCKIWFNTREKPLDEIISETKYVANEPMELMVATLLKSGKTKLCDNRQSIDYLITFLSDQDFDIRDDATKALRTLKNQTAIDAFCKKWYNSREKKLEEIIFEKKYIARTPLELRVATALKAGKTELCDNAQSLTYLVELLSDKDITIKQNASVAIQNLKEQEAIDTLCKVWFSKREQKLDKIISEKKYISKKPPNIRIATLLKAGRIGLCDNSASINHIFRFLSDKDKLIRQNADLALRSFKNQETIDALCEIAINNTIPKAKTYAIESGYKPQNIGRRCLLYVLTGQVEKYFELDFEFQYLRSEYMAAPDAIQQRIRQAIQKSGDNRLMGLFGEVRKRVVAKNLSTNEAELMLEIFSRNKQMEDVFALLFFAPLSFLVKALDILFASKWQPADDDKRALMKRLTELRMAIGKNPQLPTEPEVTLGPVFSKWVKNGRSNYTSNTTKKLWEIVASGNPPESVMALAALQAKKQIKLTDKEKLSKHPHWLVRMYAFADGLIPEAIINPSSLDYTCGGEYWLRNSPALGAFNFLQQCAYRQTPEKLEQLLQALNNTNSGELKNWGLLITTLASFMFRNTITIGAYQKRIEDTAISI